jgi:hypothetical protein
MRDFVIIIKDDLDHEQKADVTRNLGVDGVIYEIDLTAEHSEQLDALLAPYLRAGRRQAGGKARSTRVRVTAPPASPTVPPAPARRRDAAGRRRPGREWRDRVRTWGKDTKHPLAVTLGDRGRLPLRLLSDYIAANPRDPMPAEARQPIHDSLFAANGNAPAPPRTATPNETPADLIAWRGRVRAWARETGHAGLTPIAVKTGKIPASVCRDYEATHLDDLMPDLIAVNQPEKALTP